MLLIDQANLGANNQGWARPFFLAVRLRPCASASIGSAPPPLRLKFWAQTVRLLPLRPCAQFLENPSAPHTLRLKEIYVLVRPL